MNNPYDVLGVPRTASDADVKSAYRALAKKYHPDNYSNAPDIADVAADKMREVNEAYNTIMKERKNGGSSSAGAGSSSANTGSSAGASQSGSKPGWGWNGWGAGKQQTGNAGAGTSANAGAGAAYSSANAGRYSTTSDFTNVRGLIMAGRYDDADEVLNMVSAERRSAEWYFLKGTVLYSRGWLEQSFTYLQTAVNMDPNNNEYRAAYNQASNMRGGGAGGYKVSGKEGVGCNICSSCCSFMCADQCCECCGGDLITCC